MAKVLPLALALLMLTATLSGCLGGEDSTEEVDITTYAEQIDTQEATINQLLSNLSDLESNYAAAQDLVNTLQEDVVAPHPLSKHALVPRESSGGISSLS